MKNFNSNTENKDEWLTPPYIIKVLGEFDLDPCAPINRPWSTANIHYTLKDDGLSKEWIGRVWLNPPYGRETFKWMKKLFKHKLGIALIFARTETKGFHEYIWNKASGIFFFKGRLKFYHKDGSQGGTANASSCLVSYSLYDNIRIKEAIEKGQLKGKFISLNSLMENK